MQISDWIGTVGVFAILVAYFCSTFNWMSAHSRLFFCIEHHWRRHDLFGILSYSLLAVLYIGRNMDNCIPDWMDQGKRINVSDTLFGLTHKTIS